MNQLRVNPFCNIKKRPFVSVGSAYLYRVFDPAAYAVLVQELAEQIRMVIKTGTRIDAIVGRGMSGAMVGPACAAHCCFSLGLKPRALGQGGCQGGKELPELQQASGVPPLTSRARIAYAPGLPDTSTTRRILP